MQGVQLLLDVSQHTVHVLHTGVEGHFGLHHTGRAGLLGRAEDDCRSAQRRQQRPQLVDRQHRAQHHERQRRRIVRQHTGLLGADDLAHGRFSSSGADAPYSIHNTALLKKHKDFMKILHLGHHLTEIHGPSAAPQTSRSFSGRQAALAGLVLGSLTAAMPDTGCKYLV